MKTEVVTHRDGTTVHLTVEFSEGVGWSTVADAIQDAVSQTIDTVLKDHYWKDDDGQ